MPKMISISKEDAIHLLSNSGYGDLVIHRRGRHVFINANVPISIDSVIHYDAKGNVVHDGHDVAYSARLTHVNGHLESVTFDVDTYAPFEAADAYLDRLALAKSEAEIGMDAHA